MPRTSFRLQFFSYSFCIFSSLCLCVSVVSSSAFAQRDAQVPDPDPEIERKALQAADGFEVNLFAADPLLAKPIQMNFDSAGRLWVACSESYPQIKPGQKANDKIILLEDADGDGKADKTTVFADGLLIPTGLEPGDGGVYVGASTDLLHLSRPDGDKGALRRRVVLSGFGTEDTHHMVHTLRWGHDGMLYFNQSIYIHSHIETPYGPRRLGGGGVWQFRPETRRLEVFARGWWNPWGHHFDRLGQSFVTDGAGTEGVNPVIVGASYTATPREARVLQGLNPGHPKYCGCEIVSGRHRAGRLARQSRHQRFSRSSRLSLHARPGRLLLHGHAASRSDPQQSPRLSSGRCQDGTGWRHLHRRLVQPDHPARRSRFPRSAPRCQSRPYLAHHRQGPAARAAPATRQRQDGGTARSAEGARRLDAASCAARPQGARRVRAAGIEGVDG